MSSFPFQQLANFNINYLLYNLMLMAGHRLCDYSWAIEMLQVQMD